MSQNNYDPLAAMTSSTHKNRGSCCKSACIHCPYGFTMKRFGLKFTDITEKNKSDTQSLLGSKIQFVDYPIEDYKIVTLKDVICGVIRVDHLFVRELALRDEFSDQGITKEIVESYYFY